MGSRISYSISCCQYPCGNKKRFPPRKPKKILCEDCNRRLRCDYHRSFSVWKNPSFCRKTACCFRKPDWWDWNRYHTGKKRAGRKLYYQTDGEKPEKFRSKAGEIEWKEKRWCCYFWRIRCRQAVCRWIARFQEPIFVYKNEKCCRGCTKWIPKINGYVQ